MGSANAPNGHALHLCPIHFLEFQELSAEPFMRTYVLRDPWGREGGGSWATRMHFAKNAGERTSGPAHESISGPQFV